MDDSDRMRHRQAGEPWLEANGFRQEAHGYWTVRSVVIMRDWDGTWKCYTDKWYQGDSAKAAAEAAGWRPA